MLKILRLSVRNLTRYRTRTVITIVAVLISVMVSTVVDGLVRGIFEMSTANLLLYESAEVSVYANGYFEKRKEYPSDILITPAQKEAVMESLEKAGYVTAPRFITSGELITWDDDAGSEFDLGIILVGVEKRKDGNVFRISESITEGTWLENPDDVVIGSKVADKLGLDVGSYVTLSTKGAMGFAETLELNVAGIVTTEDPQVNSSQIFMSLDDLDHSLMLEGSVTEIAVSDSLLSTAPKSFADKVNALLPEGVSAKHYEQVNDDLMAIMNGDRGSSFVLLLFLFLIAGAGISNTMIMAQMERRKENAMLRSIGFSRRSIVSMFVLEGTMTGIIGALTGAVLALLIMIPLAENGINLSGLLSDDMDIGYRIPLIMRPGFYWQSFVTIPFCAVLLSAFSAFLPVYRTGKEEIAELFRRA
ncbi:MAG: ABC transporter permease [Bullifex sp.]